MRSTTCSLSRRRTSWSFCRLGTNMYSMFFWRVPCCAIYSPFWPRCLTLAKIQFTSPSSLSRLSVMKVISRILVRDGHWSLRVTSRSGREHEACCIIRPGIDRYECNLLSVAYKNIIGARRASWRIVSSIEQKEESKGNEAQVLMIKRYREKIESELAKICEDILDVLNKHLISSTTRSSSAPHYCAIPSSFRHIIKYLHPHV